MLFRSRIQTYLNDVAGVRIVCAFIDDNRLDEQILSLIHILFFEFCLSTRPICDLLYSADRQYVILNFYLQEAASIVANACLLYTSA